jgi:hypothetical protein
MVRGSQEITTSRTKREVSPVAKKQSLGDAFAAVAFRLLGRNLWGKSYTLLSSFRSCLGHIHTQLAKGQESVSVGRSFERHHQSLRRNRRTLARRRGIENLRAIHSWLDFQDLEIFLAGFDAGEQWASDKLDSEPDLLQ